MARNVLLALFFLCAAEVLSAGLQFITSANLFTSSTIFMMLKSWAVMPGKHSNAHLCSELARQVSGKPLITTSTSEPFRAELPEADAVFKERGSSGQRGCETRLCESKLITICWLLMWEELKGDTFPYNSKCIKWSISWHSVSSLQSSGSPILRDVFGNGHHCPKQDTVFTGAGTGPGTHYQGHATPCSFGFVSETLFVFPRREHVMAAKIYSGEQQILSRLFCWEKHLVIREIMLPWIENMQ